MPDIQIGAAIDAVDELLKRSGQVPKIGAGTSQPPPANPAPSRFGASALTAPPAQPELPQTHAVGAPGGTAPFMPAKIGASQQQSATAPKIGAGQSPMTVYGDRPKGMITPGNIDLNNRPVIQNPDGSHSSEYSTSFGDENGHEVLVPTIVNGKFLTPSGNKLPDWMTGTPREGAMLRAAEDHYRQTGENMGIFDNPANADAYAEAVHNRGNQPTAQPAKSGAPRDTYDPSQSPMPAGGHDYAGEYAAVHDPTPLSPDAGKPSMLRKIGGIATGAAIGAFNPQAGAKIGSSIVNAPRNELMRNYNQQEGLANQQRERISKEAGLAHTGAETADLQNRPALEAQKEAAAGQREEESLNQQQTIETQKETAAGKARQESETAAATRQEKGIAASEQRTTEQINAAAARTDKQIAAQNERANQKETPFDRSNAEGASKSVETARGGDFRYRSMAGSLPKAKAGDQQAMLNLLTNHIGMTLGMQKGARITKDILHEAQKSTPWLQGLEAKFGSDGYMSGVTLSAPQMDQMMGLAVSQRSNAWAQAIESARQAGVADKVQIPADVRIRVMSKDGKVGTIPGNQLSQAEDQGYTVAPQ